MIKLSIVAAALAALAVPARADQCQSVSPELANAAVKWLKSAPVVQYCAPCNERKPTSAPVAPPKSVTVHASAAGKSLSTVAVDGKDVDLAYTYVLTGKTTLTDVGMMIGCGAADVPGFLSLGVGTNAGAPSTDPADVYAKRAADAQAKVDRIAADLNVVDKKVNDAVNAIAGAQSDKDRQAAQAQLKALQVQKRDLESQLAAAKAEAARAEREKGTHVSRECLNNPLAKGCN